MGKVGYDNLSPEFEAVVGQLVDESERHGLTVEALRTLCQVPAFRHASCYYAKGQLTETQYWDIVHKLKIINGIA